MRRYWTVIPILAAFGLALLLANRAASTKIATARALWAARGFARYEMQAVYYDGNSQNPCTQSLVVEGETVVQVLSSTDCNAPLGGIEYPTVSDILAYLQAKTDEYAAGTVCAANGCDCDGAMGIVATYDLRVGYPTQAQIRPMYERRRASIFAPSNTCPFIGVPYTYIEVRRLIPQ